MTQTLTITRPDDWHIHLRDGDTLMRTVPDVARIFARAIVMPNLASPVTNAAAALSYKSRILSARPENSTFDPLMVLYLTNNTQPQDILDAVAAGILACKLYPAGATTNSSAGVTDIKALYPVLEAMQKTGMLLLIHGETTDNSVDIFDREKYFLDHTLTTLVEEFPALKIVLEHITTEDATQFIEAANTNVAATITAHHLLFNRNHMLAGGIRPHFYCLPILKRSRHQAALIAAATGGSAKFFLGTDSAPHAQNKKEAACGCAGSYTAYAAIELYAEAFEQAGKLDKLEGFASHFGADFYGLARNKSTITLNKTSWQAPETLPFAEQHLVPLCAGQTLLWRAQ